MKLKWKDANITGYVTSLTWTGSAAQAARTVSFNIAYSPNDDDVETLNIKLGDKITFWPDYDADKKTKFVGIVTARERKNEAGELCYTAQDGMIHLLRSSGTYKFVNKTPEKITSLICKDVGVTAGSLAKTKVNISKIFFQERAYYEIIMTAYTKAYQKAKKPYIAQMNGSKLEVIEKGEVIPDFKIKEGEQITSSACSENIDNMINRVYIYNSDNQKIGSLSKSKWIDSYGVFQNAISVDSGSGKAEAQAELHGVDKSANLTMIGDYRCTAGKGVLIKDSRSGLSGKYWIENDSHQWSGGVYTTSLELTFKNVMDTQEEDEEQASESSSSSSSASSSSNALTSVLDQARAWIGLTGSTNEATQYYGWNGVAWCCIFIWSIFNKTGNGKLFMGGGKTAACADVSSYYQARGKISKVPKVGALVLYGPNGGSHIGIVETVSGTGINDYVSIEGNTSGATGGMCARKQCGSRRSDVYGFCYIDYPATTTTVTDTPAVTGTSISVPSSVAQTGIIKDYTSYTYFYSRWNAGSMQRTVADLWASKGRTSRNGIATIDNYYLVAVRPKFGSVGDAICVVLESGARFNCIIADEKGSDAGNEWGHPYNGKISIIEFEGIGSTSTNQCTTINLGPWANKKVTTIINGGRYKGL